MDRLLNRALAPRRSAWKSYALPAAAAGFLLIGLAIGLIPFERRASLKFRAGDCRSGDRSLFAGVNIQDTVCAGPAEFETGGRKLELLSAGNVRVAGNAESPEIAVQADAVLVSGHDSNSIAIVIGSLRIEPLGTRFLLRRTARDRYVLAVQSGRVRAYPAATAPDDLDEEQRGRFRELAMEYGIIVREKERASIHLRPEDLPRLANRIRVSLRDGEPRKLRIPRGIMHAHIVPDKSKDGSVALTPPAAGAPEAAIPPEPGGASGDPRYLSLKLTDGRIIHGDITHEGEFYRVRRRGTAFLVRDRDVAEAQLATTPPTGTR